MFVDAIERVDLFTRPLHSIVRLYGHDVIVPGTATLFFVNQEGCAVTCKHVADLIAQADTIYQHYREFQGARRDVLREKNAAQLISQLEAKFKLSADTIIRVRNNFVGCVDQFERLNIDRHPTQDLALLRFEGYQPPAIPVTRYLSEGYQPHKAGPKPMSAGVSVSGVY